MSNFDNPRIDTKPLARIVLVAWSLAMIFLLFHVVDKVFEFHILNFEMFVSVLLFSIIILILLCLSWILKWQCRYAKIQDEVDETIKRIKEKVNGITD
jgi:hypothetical protein